MIEINTALVKDLIRTQFPQWAELPAAPVENGAASSLLVNEGRLCAVIDFGCMGTGDPSCDLVIAWTFLDRDSRENFRSAIALDPPAWERARGWGIWKDLITIMRHRGTNPAEANRAFRAMCDILDDHSRTAQRNE